MTGTTTTVETDSSATTSSKPISVTSTASTTASATTVSASGSAITVNPTGFQFESQSGVDTVELSSLATALDIQWSSTEWLEVDSMTGTRTGSTFISSSSERPGSTASATSTSLSGSAITVVPTGFEFESQAGADTSELSALATALDNQWSSEWSSVEAMSGTVTGTKGATPSQTATPSKTVTPPQSTTSSQSIFPLLTGGAPPAPNESLICQDSGQAKFQISDADQHVSEYCSAFDGTAYPAITASSSALTKYWSNSAGVRIELWSNINTQDSSCIVGQVKFSQADCITALQDAMNKCHDPNSQDTTGGNAEPFNCANFGFIGDNVPPPSTTNMATTSIPAQPAFTCTSSK